MYLIIKCIKSDLGHGNDFFQWINRILSDREISQEIKDKIKREYVNSPKSEDKNQEVLTNSKKNNRDM